MIFRTLLFFVLMYFLVKFISRMFLPDEQKNKKRKGPGFFYSTFQQFQQQQQQKNGHRRQQTDSPDRFAGVEEAEYEDITEEEKSGAQEPD